MIVKGCNSQTRCAGHSFINSIYILKEQLSRVWNHQPSMDRGHIKIRPLCSSQMMRHPLGQGNVLPHRRQSHSTYQDSHFLPTGPRVHVHDLGRPSLCLFSQSQSTLHTCLSPGVTEDWMLGWEGSRVWECAQKTLCCRMEPGWEENWRLLT